MKPAQHFLFGPVGISSHDQSLYMSLRTIDSFSGFIVELACLPRTLSRGSIGAFARGPAGGRRLPRRISPASPAALQRPQTRPCAHGCARLTALARDSAHICTPAALNLGRRLLSGFPTSELVFQGAHPRAAAFCVDSHRTGQPNDAIRHITALGSRSGVARARVTAERIRVACDAEQRRDGFAADGR